MLRTKQSPFYSHIRDLKRTGPTRPGRSLILVLKTIKTFQKLSLVANSRIFYNCRFYKAFRHVQTLFVQGRNLVPSRPAIGWWKVNKPCQPITRFVYITATNSRLAWYKVSTCRKALNFEKLCLWLLGTKIMSHLFITT